MLLYQTVRILMYWNVLVFFFQAKSNIDGLDVGFYGDRMGCNKNYQPARYCTKSLSEMSDQVPYGDSTLLAKP